MHYLQVCLFYTTRRIARPISHCVCTACLSSGSLIPVLATYTCTSCAMYTVNCPHGMMTWLDLTCIATWIRLTFTVMSPANYKMLCTTVDDCHTHYTYHTFHTTQTTRIIHSHMTYLTDWQTQQMPLTPLSSLLLHTRIESCISLSLLPVSHVFDNVFVSSFVSMSVSVCWLLSVEWSLYLLPAGSLHLLFPLSCSSVPFVLSSSFFSFSSSLTSFFLSLCSSPSCQHTSDAHIPQILSHPFLTLYHIHDLCVWPCLSSSLSHHTPCLISPNHVQVTSHCQPTAHMVQIIHRFTRAILLLFDFLVSTLPYCTAVLLLCYMRDPLKCYGVPATKHHTLR